MKYGLTFSETKICSRCGHYMQAGDEVYAKSLPRAVSCVVCAKLKEAPASRPSIAKAIEASQALAIAQFNKWRAEKLARGEACNL